MSTAAPLKDRIAEALADAEMSPTELARCCNVSDVSVHKWLNGKTKKLSSTTLFAAARCLRVRVEWLRTGKGAKRGDAADQVNSTVHELARAAAALTEPMQQFIAIAQRLQRELQEAEGNNNDKPDAHRVSKKSKRA